MNYFAYASNLDKKAISQICPGGKARFTADLPNHKLFFVGYSRLLKGGYPSFKQFKGQRVPGVVYEVSEADVKKLDKAEDCPATYNRVNVIVWTDSSEQVEAFTYITQAQSPE